MRPNSYRNLTLVILVGLNYKVLFVLRIKALVEIVIFFHCQFKKTWELKSQTYCSFLNSSLMLLKETAKMIFYFSSLWHTGHLILLSGSFNQYQLHYYNLATATKVQPYIWHNISLCECISRKFKNHSNLWSCFFFWFVYLLSYFKRKWYKYVQICFRSSNIL